MITSRQLCALRYVKRQQGPPSAAYTREGSWLDRICEQCVSKGWLVLLGRTAMSKRWRLTAAGEECLNRGV